MNVLFVNYHDFSSNSAVHICNLASQLVEAGVGCAVAVPGDPRTVTLLGDQPFATLDFAGARNGALRFPDGKPPTLVHAWTPRESVRRLTEELSTRHGCPYVVHLEDNEDAITASRLGLTLEELHARPVGQVPETLAHPVRMRELLADAAGMTVIIDRLLEFRADGVPAEIVWPAYEPELFTDEPADAELRRRLGIADDESVLVYPGNVHDANAAEMRSLYLAVAALNRSGRRVRLVRLGRDFVRFVEPELRELHDHVVHLPLLPRSEVARHMRLAVVLVQPGRPDAFNDYRFPSKLPEFFACGRPVVLPETNLGRYVADGEDCVLLRRGDALEIAAAVERILADDELRERLGRGARDFAERTFSWPESAEKLLGLYERALASEPRPHSLGVPVRLDTMAPPGRLGYATVRDYCDSAERLPALVRSGDLKDAQRPWVLKAVAATAPPGARLLEVGAGEPIVASMLCALGYDVTVIDPYDGRDRGPTGLDSLRSAYPGVRFVRGLYPEEIPDEERFDCVYSISVLEHLPASAIERTCAALLEHTDSGGFTIHAVDHVLLGAGDADHRARLGLATAALGIAEPELDALLERLADDPDTYFLSAEGHNRWRGPTPYERFPMRRCVSIELSIPGRG